MSAKKKMKRQIERVLGWMDLAEDDMEMLRHEQDVLWEYVKTLQERIDLHEARLAMHSDTLAVLTGPPDAVAPPSEGVSAGQEPAVRDWGEDRHDIRLVGREEFECSCGRVGLSHGEGDVVSALGHHVTAALILGTTRSITITQVG